MKQKYLTISDASKLTTLAKSTLYSYVHFQAIPFLKIGGRIIFEEESIKKWMDKKQIKEVKRI